MKIGNPPQRIMDFLYDLFHSNPVLLIVIVVTIVLIGSAIAIHFDTSHETKVDYDEFGDDNFGYS